MTEGGPGVLVELIRALTAPRPSDPSYDE